jgi:putative ABC transport system ATP-binding protein
LIRISELDFSYGEGDFRLRIPDLQVERGSTTALIGPSGSGKTTLLNLVAGISTPREGRIETAGVEVTGLSDAERRNFRITRIGLIFQEFELLEYLDVLDNMLLPYRINPALGLDREVRERAKRLATSVGIEDKLARYPGKLSQGERQRVAVCRAVLPQPVLLLADEPTGNLDPSNTERVLDILFDYARASGATMLTVTHDHDLLRRFERVVDFKQFQDDALSTRAREVRRACEGGEAS